MVLCMLYAWLTATVTEEGFKHSEAIFTPIPTLETQLYLPQTPATK